LLKVIVSDCISQVWNSLRPLIPNLDATDLRETVSQKQRDSEVTGDIHCVAESGQKCLKK